MSSDSIRACYEEMGVDAYYQEHGGSYINPHFSELEIGLSSSLKECLDESPREIVDLACGSGEVTKIVSKIFVESKIIGIDPYTHESYKKRTGHECLTHSFQELANLQPEMSCDLIICSYALHLVDSSYLHILLEYLSRVSPKLIVVTPHKNPHIVEATGWKLKVEKRYEGCRQRYRLYLSSNFKPTEKTVENDVVS